MKGDYIIIGDTTLTKDCLVCICGNKYEHAYATWNRITKNPTEKDKNIIKGYTNFRIRYVDFKDCWWNYSCD